MVNKSWQHFMDKLNIANNCRFHLHFHITQWDYYYSAFCLLFYYTKSRRKSFSLCIADTFGFLLPIFVCMLIFNVPFVSALFLYRVHPQQIQKCLPEKSERSPFFRAAFRTTETNENDSIFFQSFSVGFQSRIFHSMDEQMKKMLKETKKKKQ